jgi:hypothetical protein
MEKHRTGAMAPSSQTGQVREKFNVYGPNQTQPGSCFFEVSRSGKEEYYPNGKLKSRTIQCGLFFQKTQSESIIYGFFKELIVPAAKFFLKLAVVGAFPIIAS